MVGSPDVVMAFCPNAGGWVTDKSVLLLGSAAQMMEGDYVLGSQVARRPCSCGLN